MKCGYTLRKGQACPSCAEHAYTFTQARSWAVYQDQLREAILFLKRKPNESLAETLGSGLARILKQEDWKPDIIVPIPLFADRLKTRGYNQADLLARAVGQDLGIPVSPNALLRRRSTRAQMDLHPGQRWENVRGAFSADRASVAGARVLLIDDIITTGATMHAAATALKEADASEVYALSLARALG
jgi:ComF family protein